MNKVLKVDNLSIWYNKNPIDLVVDHASFEMYCGEILGIAGKSGSGKSTIAWTIMGMLKDMGGYAEGTINFNNENILNYTYKQYQKIKWKQIAIVPQAAMNSINPIMKIKDSIIEVLKFHNKSIAKKDIKYRCEELMNIACLDKKVLNYYPHEMSGGMKQRAAIAIALACDPEILILDEATTGLDVLIEADVLKTVKEIQKRLNMSILFISHDLRLVEALCDRSLFIQGRKLIDCDKNSINQFLKYKSVI